MLRGKEFLEVVTGVQDMMNTPGDVQRFIREHSIDDRGVADVTDVVVKTLRQAGLFGASSEDDVATAIIMGVLFGIAAQDRLAEQRIMQ
jgi:hypothetical protein